MNRFQSHHGDGNPQAGTIERLLGVLLVLLHIFATGCGNLEVDRATFPEYEGSILAFGRQSNVIDVRSGQYALVPWSDDRFYARLLCRVEDTLLLLEEHPLDPLSAAQARDGGGTARLLKYIPLESTLVDFSSLRWKSFEFRTLDFLATTGEYLFAGVYQGNEGVFLFNRSFDLTDNVTSLCLEGSALPLSAFFLGPDRILVSTRGNYGVYLVDIEEESRVRVASGSVSSVSTDHSMYVVASKPREPDRFDLLFVDGRPSLRLDFVDGAYGRTCFSSNNGQIAYDRFCPGINETFQLCIHDLISGSSYRTAARTGWATSLHWVDRRFPELFNDSIGETEP